MSDPPTDEALMVSLVSGHDASLRILMDRWQVPLRAFLQRYLQNEHEAMDLAQETFVRVYLHRARFRASMRFSTWMFQIALNLARDRCRWWRIRRHHSIDADDAPAIADHRRTPLASAEHAERVAQVRRAIAALPRHLRSIVLFAEFEQLPQAQIAAIEGITLKAVETRLARARKKLRVLLAAGVPEGG